MSEPQVTSFSFGPKNQRGVCSICGAQAYKGSATKCETHRKAPAKAPRVVTSSDTSTISPEEIAAAAEQSKAPRVEVPADKGKSPVDKGDKSAKAAEYKRRILAEGNPMLVKGYAQACKPIPPENFYNLATSEPTELGASILISEIEATILAKAAVELEASPMVAMGSSAVAPVMPYLLGFAAVGIVGFHVLTAMQTRQALLASFQAQLARDAANGAAQAQAQAAATPPAEAPSPEGPTPEPDNVTYMRAPFSEDTLVNQATGG